MEISAQAKGRHVGALLALISSVVWGSADFGGGILSRRVSPLLSVLYSQGAALCAVVILSAVTADVHFSSRLIWAVFAGIIGPLALALYYRALAIGPMGVVGPVSSLSGVVPVIGGLLLGEHLTLIRLLALVACIGGVALVSSSHLVGFRRENLVVIGLSASAALGFGLVFVGLARAAPVGILSTLLVQRSTNFLVMSTVIATRRIPKRIPRKDLGLLGIVGVADVTANGLFALSSSFGQLALVGALGSVYPLATATLAGVFTRERLTKTQIAGAAITVLAVIVAAGNW